MSAPNGQEVSVDVQNIIAALQSMHAAQLGAANLEAARWQAIATAAQQRVTELTARVAALDPLPAAHQAAAE